MEHCSEVVLIEFSQGRLDAVRAEAVRKHLAECSKCLNLTAELARMSSVLDTWHPETAGAQTYLLSTEGKKADRREFGWRGLVRAAAVLVFASLLGSGTGYYLAISGYGYAHDQAPVTDQAAARILHIQSLEPGSATGLDVDGAGLMAAIGSHISP